ncbi:MAG: transcription/translation regulatory transformer protein RfaH, partial [Steroidobacteraceae bacterium]
MHARPRQELLAVEHLQRQGYAAYLPRRKLPKFR